MRAAAAARPGAPPHRPAPKKGGVSVGHRAAPSLSPRAKEPWQEYWATSTWPNWQPYRPNAPVQASYDMHEAARAGIRLMPDQGSLIAGLRARIAELEARGVKLESQLRLQQQVKALRRENARLRESASAGANALGARGKEQHRNVERSCKRPTGA